MAVDSRGAGNGSGIISKNTRQQKEKVSSRHPSPRYSQRRPHKSVIESTTVGVEAELSTYLMYRLPLKVEALLGWA